MEFGWINLFGAIIIVVMMIPNIVFAVRNKEISNKCKNVVMNIIEQLGRYSCFILMWLPILVWKFGFTSVHGMLVYVIGNTVLLLAYETIWIMYLKKSSLVKAMALAVIPTCIFLLSGIMLGHLLLIVSSILFGIGHIYVTYKNQK